MQHEGSSAYCCLQMLIKNRIALYLGLPIWIPELNVSMVSHSWNMDWFTTFYCSKTTNQQKYWKISCGCLCHFFSVIRLFLNYYCTCTWIWKLKSMYLFQIQNRPVFISNIAYGISFYTQTWCLSCLCTEFFLGGSQHPPW